MEALKQRIAERAGRAGLDSEFEVLEKNIRVSSVFGGDVYSACADWNIRENLHLKSSGGTPPCCLTRLTMIWIWVSNT